MLRNREIKWLLLTMCSISLVAIVVAAFISPETVGITIVTSALLIGCSVLYTRYRYREIEKLSSYLRQISSGDYSLDVRDNQEGELSILKNDIYKVTLMLSEQSALLQEDKIKLTNAISDISHQLKTPLTSMTVMADLLSDPELHVEKRMEFTRKITIQLERIACRCVLYTIFQNINDGFRGPIEITHECRGIFSFNQDSLFLNIDRNQHRLQRFLN